MDFFKTIRFKLTLWYSALLITLAFIFVVGMNIVVGEYYKQGLPQDTFAVQFFPRSPVVREQILALPVGQRSLVETIRQDDLHKIRLISAISFVPLIILSFIGGYIIAGQMLDPLHKLNKATKELDVKNLKNQIQHPGVDDEIGELITNFNLMTGRLSQSFDLQKQFIENASHELKTPLAAIKANIESVLWQDKKLRKDVHESLQIANAATGFLDRLIEDLLLLSLVGEHLPMQEVSLGSVVENSLQQIAGLQKEYEAEIVVDMPEQLPTIKANEVLLQRALMNIMENAMKYGRKPREVNLSVSHKLGQVNFEISDNGPGIPDTELSKIFDRFYRIDKSRSRENGGSGLGLSIVKKVIEEVHKGKIIVKSEVGKGSTFTISLPA